MRKVSVVLSVSNDRVLPVRVMSEICDLFHEFKDVRLEFVIVRQAPTSGIGLITGDYSSLEVPKVVAPLLAGRADIVLGRNVGGVQRVDEPGFVAWLVSRLFRRNDDCVQAGVQAFRREALGIPVPALRVVEVPISYCSEEFAEQRG